jgi:hypothetical protein
MGRLLPESSEVTVSGNYSEDNFLQIADVKTCFKTGD